MRRHIQMIFQNPYTSLNPRMTIFDIVAEPMRLAGDYTEDEISDRVKDLISKVGLEIKHLNRYPHAFSGGQRQRIGIARALALGPKFVVADEAVSALDVSIQAQILNLFRRLQHDRGFSILFVAHDLAVVRWLCHRTAVLCRGRLVELAPTEALFRAPGHPYTKALLSAIPIPDPRRERARMPISFDPEDFQWDGTLREAEPEHFVLC